MQTCTAYWFLRTLHISLNLLVGKDYYRYYLYPGQLTLTPQVAVSLQRWMNQKKFCIGELIKHYRYSIWLFSHSSTQSEDDSDNDDDLFVNTNHPPPIEVQDSTSTDSDS